MREVHLEFSTGPTYALPLGDTKLFLHLIGGTVGITPEAAQIALDIGTRSVTPYARRTIVQALRETMQDRSMDGEINDPPVVPVRTRRLP